MTTMRMFVTIFMVLFHNKDISALKAILFSKSDYEHKKFASTRVLPCNTFVKKYTVAE